jgi:hypothetical protein
MKDVNTWRQLGDVKPPLLTLEQSANMLQPNFTQDSNPTHPMAEPGNRGPPLSVAYLIYPLESPQITKCVQLGVGVRHGLGERFQVLFSYFKYFKLHIARWPSSTNDCTASIYKRLVLAKTMKRRRTTRKASIAET